MNTTQRMSNALAKKLASFVMGAWGDPAVSTALSERRLDTEEVSALGIENAVPCALQLHVDNAETKHIVIPNKSNRIDAALVWFEDVSADTIVESRYFSPIRFPLHLVQCIMQVAGELTPGPAVISPSAVRDLCIRADISTPLSLKELYVWTNSDTLAHLVIPSLPLREMGSSAKKLANSSDWLYYATFANLLCTSSSK